MAKTGLKKYDKLPARYGSTDVDALRYRLSKVNNKIKRLQEKRIHIEAELDQIYIKKTGTI